MVLCENNQLEFNEYEIEFDLKLISRVSLE